MSSDSTSSNETPSRKRSFRDSVSPIVLPRASLNLSPSLALSPQKLKLTDCQNYSLLILKVMFDGELRIVSLGIGNKSQGGDEPDLFSGRPVSIFDNMSPDSPSILTTLSLAGVCVSPNEICNNIAQFYSLTTDNVRFNARSDEILPSVVKVAGLVMRTTPMSNCLIKEFKCHKGYLVKASFFAVQSLDDADNGKCEELKSTLVYS